MRISKLYALLAACVVTVPVCAQVDPFEEFRKQIEQESSGFESRVNRDFEDFRKKVNAEYAAAVEKSWKEFQALKKIPVPKEKRVPPVIFKGKKDQPVKNTPKPIEEVIPVVQPQPQPQPVAPVEEVPDPVAEYFRFEYCNTPLKVRLGKEQQFVVTSTNEKAIAKIWKTLSGEAYNNVLKDCLQIRSEHKLCDWAYLQMLKRLSTAYFGNRHNESVLLMAFLYSQSGYKMRLARLNNQIYLLYASDYTIYDQRYWVLDGVKYYPLDCDAEEVNICSATFPDERPLSLQISSEQLFQMQNSKTRRLQSTKYPDVQAVVQTNENLIRFFNDYPSSMINDDFGTRWAMYANTALSAQARESLYPALKRAVAGKSQYEGVSRILNFVQTSLVYDYDDKVWGHDRAFFADETLYYPYCDCEDRSILFSRIVRDLLGLDVVLVYYPGHLAAAVHFTENVTGDYLNVQGDRYVICDPTYIGAPIGSTMPNMNNASAKVVLLK